MEKDSTKNSICPLFGVCGGCSLLDISYDEECFKKQELITKIFSNFDDVKIEDGVFLGRNGLRTRTKLHISTNAKGFMARKTNEIVDIESCPLLCSELNRRLNALPYSKKPTPEICNMLAFAPHIEISGVPYHVNDDVFFQSNYSVAEKMLEHVSNYTKSLLPNIIYDIYAGVGFFSAKIERVLPNAHIVAIEENPLARPLALKNLKRTEYYTTSFENYISTLNQSFNSSIKITKQENYINSTLAIVDPPRTGLSKKAVRNLLELDPCDIIFVSCNIRSNINNIKELSLKGYKVLSARLFDMYPATNHVEVVTILTKVA